MTSIQIEQFREKAAGLGQPMPFGEFMLSEIALQLARAVEALHDLGAVAPSSWELRERLGSDLPPDHPTLRDLLAEGRLDAPQSP